MAKQKKKLSEAEQRRELLRARVEKWPYRFPSKESMFRLALATDKYARKSMARGVPADEVQIRTYAWQERMLELRTLEERVRAELEQLGFSVWDWEVVRHYVRKFYHLARRQESLTLMREWSYKATEAIWDGLNPRAVHRLVYRCWFFIKGSNSLSDLRKLRMSMAACSANPGPWKVDV